MTGPVEHVLAAGRVGGGIEQAHALAALKDKLFGTTVPPSLARYELRDELGRGAASVVYVAFDPELHREVAIKLVQTEAYADAPDAHSESRLLAEARALAKVSHPNVVSVHDVGLHREDGGPATLFVVMEWVRGQDVSQWRREPRSQAEILDVFVAAGRGLAAAHAADLVHRDFKPANVLVGDDGTVRVADFGLARTIGDAAPSRSKRPARADAPPHLTATGSLVGTPLYMAPEQHEGAAADARSDQFAFCASLYETLIGTAPFGGETMTALAEDKQAGRLAPVGNAVPRWLLRVVRRGLSRRPDDRFDTMDSVLRALEHGRKRRRRAALGALVVTTALVSAAIARPSERNEACSGFDDGLTGAWDESVRNRVGEAFAASGVSYAEEARGKVNARLDEFARQWDGARASVCTGDGPSDPERLSRGILCLERRRKALTALTGVLAEANEEVISRAAGAVAELPSPRCDDQDGEQRPAPPAIDGELDRALLLVAAQMAAGRYEAAAAGVDAIQEAADDPAALARALYLEAGLAGYANDFPRAHDTYHRALWASERAGDEVTATRTLIRLVLVVGNHLQRFEDAHRFSEHARARLDRLGLGPRDRADLEHYVGLVLYAQGDNEGALRRYDEALQLRVDGLGTDHPDVAETHLSIGAAYVAMERYEAGRDAWQTALQRSREVFGSRHPLVGHAHGNLGYVSEHLGLLDQAAEHHRTALQIHSEVVDEPHVWLGRSRLNLGRTLTELGRTDDALPHLERAVSIHAALTNPVRLAESEFALAEVLWRSDRARSLELAQRALATFEERDAQGSAHEVQRWLNEHPP